MGLFSFLRRKKDTIEVKQATAEKIIFEQLDDAIDSHLTKLATDIINGNPLVVNLESLDIDNANKVIAFLSGVIYAIEGEIYLIREKVFLFGNSEVYNDGSVKKLLEEII
ncbi:MAG: cell division protein SepF [Acholeplasma sp.]|nr:cell division protein SepF [Acholeplasma sp.]